MSLEPVETKQIAPTILRALGLSPFALRAVQREGTRSLIETHPSDENR